MPNVSINTSAGFEKQRFTTAASFQTQIPINGTMSPKVISLLMKKKVPIKGETSMIEAYSSMSPGIQGVATNSIPVRVPVSPHHFSHSLVNQNDGMVDRTSQSPDLPTRLEVTREKKSCHQLQQQQHQSFTNIKVKNSLCLISELARYNRVTHRYILVDEQGPPHKKNFFVKLQLGDKEEYSTSGLSIKKAQHAAADMALANTAFKHPPPKPLHRPFEKFTEFSFLAEDDTSIAATVELNALAMKRGEPVTYRVIENINIAPVYYQPHNYDFRGMYNQRYHTYMQPPVRMSFVSVKVGNREFIGEGITHQHARHNAAQKALNALQTLQTPNGSWDNKSVTSVVSNENNNSTLEASNKMKSEISRVHEIALCHNLLITFEVIHESGPPHQKIFVTRCVVGNFKTEAEGSSKKLSKKHAAELMLTELNSLSTSLLTSPRPKNKSVVFKKKNRNFVKKAEPSCDIVGMNPISRLIQIQQTQKKKEPIFMLLEERGLSRQREFVMQVQVEEHTCIGVGSNKKLAKRHAAEDMLQLLGYNKPSPQPAKPALKMQGEASNNKRVTFSDSPQEQEYLGPAVVNGRQTIPGLIVLPEGNRNTLQFKAFPSLYNKGPMVSVTTGGLNHNLKHNLQEVCDNNNIDFQFDGTDTSPGLTL